MPDGFVVFDDVFVPTSGSSSTARSSSRRMFAHSLGLWERLGGIADHGRRSATPGRLGAAGGRGQRAARGLAHQGEDRRDGHLRDAGAGRPRGGHRRNAHATAGGLRASPTSCSPTRPSTTAPPTSALMVRHLHDIAGGSVHHRADRSPTWRTRRLATRRQVHAARCRASTASTGPGCSTPSAT